MEAWRDQGSIVRAISARQTLKTPDMTFSHRSNYSRPHPLNHAPIIIAGMDLYSHLGGKPPVPGGQPGNGPRFINRMGQWFLAIDVPPGVQRCGRNDRMRMIRGADHHRIYVLLLEQLPAIS